MSRMQRSDYKAIYSSFFIFHSSFSFSYSCRMVVIVNVIVIVFDEHVL